MTFAYSHNLGSLGDGKVVFQNAVEHLNPCLFNVTSLMGMTFSLNS